MRLYDGRLYYADTYLYIVDAATGTPLHKFESTDKNGSIFTPPAVDLDNKVMYVRDSYYLTAVQLPE